MKSNLPTMSFLLLLTQQQPTLLQRTYNFLETVKEHVWVILAAITLQFLRKVWNVTLQGAQTQTGSCNKDQVS